MKNKNLLAAISTLTGTIIGAGVLALPYVISKSGFFFGLIHIIFLGILILIIRLCIGEVVLRTKGNHQLTGYAEIYFGKIGKILMSFSMIFGVYTALIAYIIGEGESLSFLFTSSKNHILFFCFLFWVFVSFLVARGIKVLEKAESYSFFAVISIFLVIFFYFLRKIYIPNLTYISTNPFEIFLPYGVVLFSYLGFTAIPEMKEELRRNEKLMKKAIIVGSIIPIFIYIFFVFVVVGFTGKNTPQIATIGLGKLPTLFGCFTMFTASFALCIALKQMYEFDFKIKKKGSWFLSCFIPLLLSFIIIKYKLATFVEILGLSGSIAGGINGILTVLMFRKAKKFGNRKPEYEIRVPWIFIVAFILIFLLGIIYEFLV